MLILIQVQEENGIVPKLHDLSITIQFQTPAVLDNGLQIAGAAVVLMLFLVVVLLLLWLLLDVA